MTYDNTNRGAMFKNETKKSNNSPDYSGSLNVDGEEFFLDGWIKESGPNSRNPGSKFLSVSVKKKSASSRPVTPPNPVLGFDSDIPF